MKANAAITPAGVSGNVSFFATDATDLVVDINGYFVPAGSTSGFVFYPLTPCRLADTRSPDGPYGGPSLPDKGQRNFSVYGVCSVPPTAKAYAINYTAVPKGTLGYLSTWPGDKPQPLVSTLNSWTGTVVANAAIVPAGQDGSINVYASNATDLVMDITGYFAPEAPGGESFYALQPCRVFDSRKNDGVPLTAKTSITLSNSCGVPSDAQAAVLNATVVPSDTLGFLTLWQAGQSMPSASILNSWDGDVTSNMGIIPMDAGALDLFGSNPTHVILDVLGYFAP